MIQFVEMECPNCAGKLQKSGEKTAKCSHCGMEFLIDEFFGQLAERIYGISREELTPEELASIIPNPGQIISLGCYSASSLNGIDAFENLEQLYINDYELSDIGALSAVKKLKDLQIDSGESITDNYVTDIRPLEKLSNLESVWCGENSISQGDSLSDHVTVIFDSEAEFTLW